MYKFVKREDIDNAFGGFDQDASEIKLNKLALRLLSERDVYREMATKFYRDELPYCTGEDGECYCDPQCQLEIVDAEAARIMEGKK
jgi:hypothetical protein